MKTTRDACDKEVMATYMPVEKKLELAKLIIEKLEKFFLSKHTHLQNPCECDNCKLLAEVKLLKEHI